MDIGAITAGSVASPVETARAAAPGSGGKAFGAVFEQVLANQSQAETAANQAIQNLATGKADNLHAVSLAVAEADLSFRLILELRNKLTEAYQEVMRMQV